MKLFAQTCEKLSTESSSLNKVEIISQSLCEIKTNEELYLFCMYLTGAIFPSSTQKTINVGKALIRDAVLNLFDITKEDWERIFRENGETGEAVFSIINNLGSIKKETLNNLELIDTKKIIYSPRDDFSLQEVNNYIEKLVQTSGSLAKVKIIEEILSQLNAIEAKYICKLLLQNLRIGVQEATVETAIAKAFEVDKKQVSELNFYLGDIGEIAIRCKEKNFSDIEFRLFHPIKAMLASAEVEIDEIFQRMSGEKKPKKTKIENIVIENQKLSENSLLKSDHLHIVWAEYKYDGVRAHIHKRGDRVEIFTRDQKRITDQFPEIVRFFLGLKVDDFLLDGEIVPFSGGKIHPFALIQKRLGKKEGLEKEVLDNPAVFIAYDFLYLQKELLFDFPLSTRRKMLETTFAGTGLMFSTIKNVKSNDEFLDFFKLSKSEGREGLMIKNPNSKYESGKRGINWLKYKQTLDPLDVVILIAEFGEGKNSKYLSSFTFGVWDKKKENLIQIGRVASGANEEDLKHFTEFLPTISIEKLPNGFKLKPIEIIEVGFENIQVSERFESGWAVRFPRLLRIRTGDKPLDEISTIQDIKRIYETIKGKTTS